MRVRSALWGGLCPKVVQGSLFPRDARFKDHRSRRRWLPLRLPHPWTVIVARGDLSPSTVPRRPIGTIRVPGHSSEVTRSLPVRAIAFDLFHTIVDPEDFRPKEFIRTREISKLIGLPEREFEEFWTKGRQERIVTMTPSVTDRVRIYCAGVGLSPSTKIWPLVDDILGRYTDLAIRNPRRSILDSLQRLRRRGFVIGLLSNCDEREVRSWPGTALSKLFDATVFSCEVGFAKPSPESYFALVPKWGSIPLREAIFVGDGANDELSGARHAGFSHVVFDSEFVAVNGLRSSAENERLRKESDSEVTSLSQLESLIASWE